MLTDHQFKSLERSIRKNRCVLLLGAGFSVDARNQDGDPIPSGKELAGRLWNLLGYQQEHGEYDGTTQLQILFEAARNRLGDRTVLTHLQRQLSIQSYPDWYRLLTRAYWHRIYSLNVDHLVERVFGDVVGIPVKVINALLSSYEERDNLLGTIQYIKLNGSLIGDLDTVVFGKRDYAARSSLYDPWYDHFVRDYAQYATILVGTQLDEQQFWQALESRRSRRGATVEKRNRSFLVSPRISPALGDSLADFNVVPIRETAADFFIWLFDHLGTLPDRAETLVDVDPRLVTYVQAGEGLGKPLAELDDFFRAFSLVSPTDPNASYRSPFLLGATPTWDDLAADLDARRNVNDEVFQVAEQLLEEAEPPPLLVISGHTGSGKSTVLMRTVWDLTAAGHTCLFATGEDISTPWVVASAVEQLGRKLVLAIDDAEWVGAQFSDLLGRLHALEFPPLVVAAVRSNALYRLEERSVPMTIIDTGDLTNRDIMSLISVLRNENHLGVMTGRPNAHIEREFKSRLKKQLLVAMKEVTAGKRFDEIIRKEYEEIEQNELRTVYLAACLATAASASLLREQLIAVAELPPAQLLSALERELRQLLIPDGSGTRLAARHSIIASIIVDKIALRSTLAIAYRRVLEVLAHDIGREPMRGAGRRWFRLYKRLIDHDQIYKRFESDLNEARSIYEAVEDRFRNDPHFWLQYGSLELQYGELEFADLYLRSASALRPDDFLIRHARAHLLMRQATAAPNQSQAIALRSEAEEQLKQLIAEREDSPYPWHTLILQIHHWIQEWEPDLPARRKEYESLLNTLDEAITAFPWDKKFKGLEPILKKRYLETAL